MDYGWDLSKPEQQFEQSKTAKIIYWCGNDYTDLKTPMTNNQQSEFTAGIQTSAEL